MKTEVLNAHIVRKTPGLDNDLTIIWTPVMNEFRVVLKSEHTFNDEFNENGVLTKKSIGMHVTEHAKISGPDMWSLISKCINKKRKKP